MRYESFRDVQDRADYLPYLHRLILYTIASHLHKDAQPRVMKGQRLEGRETFIPRADMMRATGCTDSRSIARACRELEAVGLPLRKGFTTKTGRVVTAVHGRATVYRCPTADELDAARPLWEALHPKRSKVAPQPPMEGADQADGDSGERGERVAPQPPHWVAEEPPHWVAPQPPHCVPMSDVSSIHSRASSHSAEATNAHAIPTKWRHPDYGSVRVGSDGVPRPYGRVARLRWEKDGAPVLEPPRREGASPTGRGAA